MISYARELPKLRLEAEFEEMCSIVYGDVFKDPLPKLNGRRGQNQAGVDVYLRSTTGRVGVQCKRYKDGSLKLKHVTDEIEKAEVGPVKIVLLIIATTAVNDAKLLAEVMALSDERETAGKFAVQIEFWDDIRGHIARSSKLQALYDPNAPGALFQTVLKGQDGISQALDLMTREMQSLKSTAFDMVMPSALETSLNNAFTHQIDSIMDLLEAARYREANDRLSTLSVSFHLLDAHQKARWHVQRGICRIHLFGQQGAADDFISACEIYPHDPKIAAAGIRGLTLQHRYDEAIAAGANALKEWPGSVDVWTAFAFARMEHGESVTIDDVPAGLNEERRILSLLCWASVANDDKALAAAYGRQLLALPDPSVQEKTTAFTAALMWATEDPVARDHGFVEPNARRYLEAAVAALEPRGENLWKNQSLASVPADASNLCYAYYVLDRCEDVLAMCAEAAGCITLPNRMASLKLVALKALGRHKELLALVPNYFAQIEPAAIAGLAEVAAWYGRVDLVQQLAERAREEGAAGYDFESIFALSALAMLNAGRRDDALRAVEHFHYRAGHHPGATIVASRVLLAAGMKEEANERVDEVVRALPDLLSPEVRLMLADCLFFLKRYRETVALYSPYCVPGHFSVLHTRLLRSYVESGQRARARSLLASFPAGWADDDDARETAISLAQRAADWPRLLELANQHVALRPDSAGAWLLRLIAERHGGSKPGFLKLIAEVPEQLKGSIRQQAQLAALQLQYGQFSLGVRRLYRMLRTNMHDPAAASSYMTCMLMRSSKNELEETAVVAPGTTVSLIDESGVSVSVSVEPTGMGDLPQQTDFHAPDASLVVHLLGKSPGDKVEIPGSFGNTRSYSVASVESVYLTLLRQIQERVHSSPEGLPAMWSVNLQSEDGNIDLTEMAKILGRSSDSARNVFDTYASNPITLGICAKVLRVSALELAQGWPVDAPPLRVSEGDFAELEAAAQALRDANVPIVADLTSLGELVSLGCADALSSYPKMHISSASVHILEGLIEDASDDQTVGRAASIDGQVRFIAIDEQYKSARLRYLTAIKDAIERYCTVKPAYGVGDTPDDLAKFEEVLGEDEYETLLLAKELGATLFSIDLALRQLAALTFGIAGVWTQPLLAEAASKGSIPVHQYRNANQLLFRSNRTFVAVESDDLLMMCRQGGVTLSDGLDKVRTVFQSPQSDAKSCAHVIEGLIEGMMYGPITLGAMRELVAYLYEPLFRHPGRLPDLEERARRLMRTISKGFTSLPSWVLIASLRAENQSNREAIFQFLARAVTEAKRLAADAPTQRRFPFETVKVSRIPELRLVRSDANAGAMGSPAA